MKDLFLDKTYEVDYSLQNSMLEKNPNLDKDSLEFIGLKNLTKEILLKELGFKKPNTYEGKFLIVDYYSENYIIGEEILNKLDKYGLKIADLSIQNIKFELEKDRLKALKLEEEKKALAEKNLLEAIKLEEERKILDKAEKDLLKVEIPEFMKELGLKKSYNIEITEFLISLEKFPSLNKKLRSIGIDNVIHLYKHRISDHLDSTKLTKFLFELLD